MKILHINSYYSYYGKPGFHKNLYDTQVSNGDKIAVYVPLDYEIDTSKFDFGDYTKIVKTHNSYDRYVFRLKHEKIFRDIKKQYKISGFDLIHAHSLFSNGYIAYKLFKKYGIPYIVAVRDTDVNIFFKKLFHLRNLGIKIMQDAEKIVFLSPTYKELTLSEYVPERLRESMREKTVVIPNGIDPFWLENKEKGSLSSNNKNELNIIFAGHVSKRKNPSTTAEACSILQKKGYKVKFTVVGPISDRNEYEKLMRYDFVNYIDPQPKENLINIYRDNEIFVMPSITETFGLVYVEAMSQGLPVIYSKGQGFDGQFSEGIVGYHVDCFNAFEISNRIIQLIDNYESIKKNCLELCENFRWENIHKMYLEIYEK